MQPGSDLTAGDTRKLVVSRLGSNSNRMEEYSGNPPSEVERWRTRDSTGDNRLQHLERLESKVDSFDSTGKSVPNFSHMIRTESLRKVQTGPARLEWPDQVKRRASVGSTQINSFDEPNESWLMSTRYTPAENEGGVMRTQSLDNFSTRFQPTELRRTRSRTGARRKSTIEQPQSWSTPNERPVVRVSLHDLVTKRTSNKFGTEAAVGKSVGIQGSVSPGPRRDSEALSKVPGSSGELISASHHGGDLLGVSASETVVDRRETTNSWHEKLRTTMNTKLAMFLSFMCSVWMLIGRDIYLACAASTEYDTAAFQTSTFVMVSSILENFAWSQIYPLSYALTIRSFLDFLSALSLIPDCIAMVTKNSSDSEYLMPLSIAKISIVAMSGTRLIKMLRLGFTILSPKSKELVDKKKEGDDESKDKSNRRTLSEPPDPSNTSKLEEGSGGYEGWEEKDVPWRESEVGSKLNRGIAKIQIAVVAAILVVTHFLHLWSRAEAVGYSLLSVSKVASFLAPELAAGKSTLLLNVTLEAVAEVYKNHGLPLNYVEVDGNVIWGSRALLQDRRKFPSEVFRIAMEVDEGKQAIFMFDARKNAVSHYWDNVIMALCTTTILGGSTIIMSYMVHKDVAVPMQRMVQLVTSFAEDPLRPLPPAEGSNLHPLKETVILQNALVKFGSLLQLGFGEAGAAMLSKSINSTKQIDQQLETSEQAFERILDVGRVVQAFFGFCDIRYFTDLTEILQADVVRVANSVARHVHQSVRDNYGAPNKNMGDTFLLVWMARQGSNFRKIADASLRSFIRAVLEVSRNKEIAKICSRSEVLHRMPDFKLQLGFGLHYGWAIECAIGSGLKIDASYLSPHVNLASRLQSATKQYGVSILVSGATYSLFSPSIQAMCRLVDRVTFKGTAVPMELYTYDVPPATVNGIHVVDDELISSPSTSDQAFFRALQPATSERFRNHFGLGMDFYLGGPDGDQADWTKATMMLNQCLLNNPKDGPSLAIRSYIKRNQQPNGEAPEGWRGFRALQSK